VSEVPKIDLLPIFKAATGPKAVTDWIVNTSGPSLTYSIDFPGAIIMFTPTGRPSISLELASTPCHLGGRRWWALCPGCERRAGVVFYLRNGALRCRSCAGLAYRCQVEPPDVGDRLKAKIRKLKVKLGGEAFDTMNGPVPLRPPWMSQRRYDQTAAEMCSLYEALADVDGRRLSELRERRQKLEDAPLPLGKLAHGVVHRDGLFPVPAEENPQTIGEGVVDP